MKKRNLFVLLKRSAMILLFLSFALYAGAQTDKKDSADTLSAGILIQSGLLQKPDEMMKNWLLARIDEKQIDWEKQYELLKTPEDIKKYQKERIDYFFKQLGPLWKKTPLNANITGRIEKKEYRAEKILFESVPGFYVSGTMFLPLESKYKAPYPGVLVVCGHNPNGKGAEWMQMLCVLGAQNGLAMFIIDPIDQGDRWQLLKEDGKYLIASVAAHNVIGGGSILLGRNTATFEVWDMIRALDYMETRGDIIQNGFGAAGISGGGTQTSYIMSLDPRIRAAAPCCYICNMFDDLMYVQGPQDAEQNIFGQIGFGMDHADYCIMRAPKPTQLCTATWDFFPIQDTWKTFRFAKRIYGRLGSPEKMDLTEIDDKHHYNPELIRSTIRWMLRWLANKDGDLAVSEIAPVLALDEIRSVPAPGLFKMKNVRSTYDLNRDLAKDLAAKRKN
ncbi:MAG: hypothetical protein Q4G69_08130, partial [Planctomycetia bacterium]|nr:hypothetical protein [Planctomycetia bacterium]